MLGPEARRQLGNAENTTTIHTLMSCPIYRKYEFSDLERRSGHLLRVNKVKSFF